MNTIPKNTELSKAFKSDLFRGVDPKTLSAFHKYFYDNKLIYKHFRQIAFDLRAKGVPKYGAKGIMEIVRWRRSIETRGEYKICNSYITYYARALAAKHPQFRNFFKFKKVKGLKK